MSERTNLKQSLLYFYQMLKKDKYYHSRLKDLILEITNQNHEDSSKQQIIIHTSKKVLSKGEVYNEFSQSTRQIETALRSLIRENYIDFSEDESEIRLTHLAHQKIELGGFLNEAKANNKNFWTIIATKINLWLVLIAGIFAVIAFVRGC